MSLFDQFNWQGNTGFPYFWGYYWIGPINPHILPPIVGMTDTMTGTVYYLILNTAGDHLQLTTQAPPGPTRVLPATDFLYLGQFGMGLKVVAGHVQVTQFDLHAHVVGGPPVFAPDAEAGVATRIGGLFASNQRGAPGLDHVSVQVATIAAKTTPSEPQIPPVVPYSGYYYEVQDANRQGNLS